MRANPKAVYQASLTFALSLASISATAQPSPMFFQHLGLRDGLSQSTVTSVVQDAYGFVWIGTENGLNRYDGNAVEHYFREHDDATGLASDFIWSIAPDANGDLWLATVGGGVARWDRSTDSFEHFRHDPSNSNSLASDDIRTLTLDRHGAVWIGTNGAGLDRLDPTTAQVTHFQPDPGNPRGLKGSSIYAIHEDRSGQIWVGTEAGLNHLNPESGEIVAFTHDPANPFSLSDEHVVTILEDGQGVLWIGTANGGLNKLDRVTERFTHFRYDADDPRTLSDEHVRAILEDDAGRIWVGTANGLNLLDRRTGFFTRYRNEPAEPDSLRDNYVMSLYQDRSGLLWVGTRSSGVSRWNPRSWSLGHYNDEWTKSTNVTAFADDGRGRLWIGTFGDGLKTMAAPFEDAENANPISITGIPDDNVMSLLLDEEHILWIGTMSSGLVRFDPITGETKHYRHDPDDAQSIAANGIMTLHQDRLGRIWVGTFGGGINRFDRRTEQFERYSHGTDQPTGLSSSHATAIAEDLSGSLWIGTDGGGLNLLDVRTGRFRHFRHDPANPASISADTIYDVHIDQTGTVWIGTAGGGLVRLMGTSAQPDSIRFRGSRTIGLPSNVVYGVESDHEGNLWLSGNNGLTRYNPTTGSLKTFYRTHGAQNEEFNFGAHHKSEDGKLYFGGANGFNAFHPGDLDENAPAPQVAVTSIEKLHQPLSVGTPHHLINNLALGHRDNVLTLEFAALDFTAPEENRYSYKLEGFDSAWTTPSNVARATYTNLGAGDYVFRVRAANGDNVWNDDALAIPITVEPAPWNTVWARIFYVVLALILILLAWHRHLQKLRRETQYSQTLEHEVQDRTRQLQEKNVELERLSKAKSEFLARMSHEVRTPMNGVLGMTELLLGTTLNHQQRRFTETVQHSAKSLLEIIDDLLDYSKIEAGRLALDDIPYDLREVAEETIELLAGRAQEKGLELMCYIPSDLQTSVSGDPLRLRQVLINLIGNAVKFTERGQVVLWVSLVEETADSLRMRFDIKDTGIGIESSHRRMIFEVFAQADSSTTRRYGGTGLGLAISKQLVELMGGTLSVESEPQEGSTFHFTVDLKKAPAAARKLAPKPTNLRGLRALIVEANDCQRTILIAQLSSLAIESTGVQTTRDALAALETVAARTRPYDVVIAACSLRDRKGEDLLRSLREDTRFSRPRLVLLSPMAERIPAQLRDELRIDSHLVKPVRQAALWQTLTAMFGHSENVDDNQDCAVETPPNTPTERKRLLLVEDNRVNEAVAIGMLGQLGYDVDVARDGQQALEMFANDSFDAILMDCQLPIMDGFEATMKIRAEEALDGREAVTIIAVTANAVAGERDRCLQAGMNDYLSKPFTLDALRKTLRRSLIKEKEETKMVANGIDPSSLDYIRQLATAGTPDLLDQIIAIYLSDSVELIETMHVAIDSTNCEELRRAAHSLKSSSSIVGARDVFKLCQRLEQCAKENDLAESRRLFGRLQEIYPQVSSWLENERDTRVGCPA